MHVIVYVLHNQVIVCNMWHHSEISKTKEQRHCTEIVLYSMHYVVMYSKAGVHACDCVCVA